MKKIDTTISYEELDWLVDTDTIHLRDVAAALQDERDRLKEFARWLVTMDEPGNAEGRTARQTVTLTAIINRARQALGEG